MVAATPAATLRGRVRELDVLSGALDTLATGRPAAVLVEGEAGIGKTRLLTETLADARSRGFSVATGQGEELERTRPFGAIAEALDCSPTSPDPRRQAIAALLAGGDAGRGGHDGRGPVTVTSDAGLQFRVVDAFVDLVEDLTLHTPLVVAVDDLQWVDPSSLLTIGAIGRRSSFMPLGFIGCYRPSPSSAQLRHVVDALTGSGATQLAVGRLDESAVEALVSELVAGRPGPTLLREIVLGVAAEQVLTRRRLLLQYFGAGILSQLIGTLWQPVGGGNSVAVCGLAGALAVALWHGDERLPRFAEAATLLWCAAVLGTLPSQWSLAAVVAGVLGVRYGARLRSRGIRTARAVAVVVVLTAAVLIVFHNIHGAALAVGLALALPGRLPATRHPHVRMDLGR